MFMNIVWVVPQQFSFNIIKTKSKQRCSKDHRKLCANFHLLRNFPIHLVNIIKIFPPSNRFEETQPPPCVTATRGNTCSLFPEEEQRNKANNAWKTKQVQNSQKKEDGGPQTNRVETSKYRVVFFSRSSIHGCVFVCGSQTWECWFKRTFLLSQNFN